MPVKKQAAGRPKVWDMKSLPEGDTVLKVSIDGGGVVQVTGTGRVSKGKKGRVHWVAKDCLIAAIDFPAGSPFTGIDYSDRRHVLSLPIRAEVEGDTKWAYGVTAVGEHGVFSETDPRMIIDP